MIQNTNKKEEPQTPTNRHSFNDVSSPPSDTNSAKCTYLTHKGKKKSWTMEEDAYLMRLVTKYGPHKWSLISENMPGMKLVMQDASENSADNDGIITSIHTSIKTNGVKDKNGFYLFFTN